MGRAADGLSCYDDFRATIFEEPFMTPIKSFTVFGEPVDVLTDGATTHGLSCAVTQVSPPGGGPPPHRHEHEDETFYILSGEYEFLYEDRWHPRFPGQTFHAERGSVHTFRNCGSTPGKILVFVTPSGMEKYLEEISVLEMPKDIPQLLTISERYGISFPGLTAG